MNISKLTVEWDAEMLEYFRTWANVLSCQGHRCCGHAVFLRPVTIRRVLDLAKDLGVSLRPTNAYRCPAHNAAVGGMWDSQHVEGLAIDVALPGVQIDKFKTAARKYFGGVKIYPERMMAHLQVPPPRNWG